MITDTHRKDSEDRLCHTWAGVDAAILCHSQPLSCRQKAVGPRRTPPGGRNPVSMHNFARDFSCLRGGCYLPSLSLTLTGLQAPYTVMLPGNMSTLEKSSEADDIVPPVL